MTFQVFLKSFKNVESVGRSTFWLNSAELLGIIPIPMSFLAFSPDILCPNMKVLLFETIIPQWVSNLLVNSLKKQHLFHFKLFYFETWLRVPVCSGY